MLEQAFPLGYEKVGEFDPSKLLVEVTPSGFQCFDDAFVLKKDRCQIVTVGGFTSHGKTALMMQLAAFAAKSGPVFVHSFEMEKQALEARILAGLSSTPLSEIMRGKISEKKLRSAREDYASRRLYLHSDMNSDVDFVMQKCYQAADKWGTPTLIVIDYLQLMYPRAVNSSRIVEIGSIMRDLIKLGKQLKTTIILGSQLSTEPGTAGKKQLREKGIADYTPSLANLADAPRAISSDSNVVLTVTRPEQYDGQTRPGKADINCLKNRDGGSTFEAEMDWSGELCSFYEKRGL